MSSTATTRLSEALNSPFFANSPDAIVVVDSEGTIVAANQQVLGLLGHVHDAVVGAAVESLVPAELRKLHESHRATYANEPRRRSMGAGLKLKALHRDGSEIPVDIALSPFRADDADYTIAAIRDATQRIQAETALSQADEWRAIIDDRQRIARDLHDTVIQDIFAAGMGLQALQRRIDDEDLRHHLGSSVDHLDSVITRLRKVIFNLTHGDETEPLETAVRRLAVEARNGSNLELGIQVTSEVPLPARTQEHLLATIQEAMSNAVRHASASRVDVTVKAADGVCCLTVVDDGVGMPDAAATRPGFGLTNMLNRAQVLGGSCDITSQPDAGTTVEWKVPLPATVVPVPR